jgi:maleamate amidohydrolase
MGASEGIAMVERAWDHLLTERDRYVVAESGYGGRVGFGRRPALLIIDVTVGFCGDVSEPIEQAMVTWRNSCGEAAWRAIPVIAQVSASARAHQVPVIYSTGTMTPNLPVYSGRWIGKNTRRGEDRLADRSRVYDIVEPLTPQPSDIVIRKTKPSALFGTPLLSYLIDLGVDTLICCGTSTSGCVRSTVLDAFSNNLRVIVIEDGTFDRVESSHQMNLFDMDQKYADVVAGTEVIQYFGDIGAMHPE